MGFSYTKIENYGKCPHMLWLGSINPETKDIDRPSIPRDRGGVGHDVMAAYNNGLVAALTGQDLELLDKLALDVLRAQTKIPADYYEEVREMCKTAAIAQGELPYLTVTEIEGVTPGYKPKTFFERLFTVKVGRFTLRGIRDLVFQSKGVGVVRDYKASRRIMPQWEVDRSLQLQIYAWVLLRQHPELDAASAEFVYMPDGVIRTPKGCPWTREDLAHLEGDLTAVMEGIDADQVFEATPGSACAYCDYVAFCKHREHALKDEGTESIGTDEEAGAMAADVTILTRIKEDKEDLLKAWAETHGDIRSGDLSYGFKATHSRKFEPIAVAKAVKEAGIDPFVVLRVDAKALDKAVLKAGTAELLAQIEALTIDSSYSRWGHRKIEGGDAE